MTIFWREPPPPANGASNAGELGRNRDSEPISGFAASCQCCDRPQAARCYQNDAAAQLVTHIAAAELVNGRTRRQNVYDKKSQSYAKDNRAAFIARSDKSVANVNYKTLLDVLYHWS